ncbi:MAG: bifunctional 2-polyprenyl-6-hydroxyphenol methylase/3-demethylubiquinol 3-O-methyltransferase UbiG [Alphaproteobacteria bacterium]|nr:bifunctional 2-polyprenyl-6-hydroxyphenol methylase/3-demethylubiquinol 3-O-methyltransferase UbiG [Alphaproteobacteria bacterium]
MTVSSPPPANPSHATTRPEELRHFATQAKDWWVSGGGYDVLHAINPLRLSYIRDQLCQHFGLDTAALAPFDGLSLLDVGCGGGLIAEPLSRLGAAVTAIDAEPATIAVAQAHAAEQGLTIDYRCITVEGLDADARFDAVIALEILEHVANPSLFVAELAKRLKPGGLIVLSTLNRTPQSYLLGVVAAERLLRWVAVGTHRWSQFVKPSELAAMARAVGLTMDQASGINFHPLRRTWSLGQDLAINYLAVLR